MGAAALLLLVAGLWWRARRARARAAAAASEVLEFPVVLVHGLLGFATLGLWRVRIAYFRGLVKSFHRRGVPVYTPRLSPLGSVPQRARELADFVRALPHRRVVLLAHSMGGLDARYAVSKLGIADRVAAVVTVGTPHRGTPLADLVDRAPVRGLRRLGARLGVRTDALDWLTSRRLAVFNENVTDVPGVAYWSVVGRVSRRDVLINPVLAPLHAYVERRSGPSDGLVPVSSQSWGESIEVRAGHWAQAGWGWRFSAATFYWTLLSRIRAGTREKRAGAPKGEGGARKTARAATE